jgi:hypothetical protein
VIDFLSYYYDKKFFATTNKDEFIASDKGRINYSEARITDSELLIWPDGFLEQTGIEQVDPVVAPVNGVPALFANSGETGFDIFSGIFYLLSRYEEYLPHQKDQYGRYAHTNSIAFRHGFIKQPVIDLWLDGFTGKVRIFTDKVLSPGKFQFTPTYDIDIAWSYQGKGWLRNVGGLMRSLTRLQIGEARERLAVLMGKKDDPYNSYQWMHEVHTKFGLDPIFFFHVGEKTTQYDKNIPINDPAFRSLVQTVSSKYRIGVHPSWQSGDEPSLILKEKENLQLLSGKEITMSRQHYLRFTLPETYRLLIKAGIHEDHSMGYGTINGFRASIGSPFYWYDLEKEETTKLLVRPFCFMDANSYYEQKDSPEKALEELKSFHHILEHCGGEMITIFHNNFLGTSRQFTPWRNLYSDFLSSIL